MPGSDLSAESYRLLCRVEQALRRAPFTFAWKCRLRGNGPWHRAAHHRRPQGLDAANRAPRPRPVQAVQTSRVMPVRAACAAARRAIGTR
jgi:hypothetical protein